MIKVSIIIPTYNRGHLLGETLRSVQEQTLADWECNVIDDGSTDDTKNIVEGYLKDSRFKYYTRPDHCEKGANGSRNFGLEMSRGKYIQWLDDDDLLSNNKLQKQVDALERSNSNHFASCSWDYYWPGKSIDLKNYFENERIIEPESFFLTLAKYQTFMPVNTFLIPRILCSKVGGWNENLTLNDDAEYISRILLESKGLLNIPGCFALYRNHSEERLSRKMDELSLYSFLLSLDIINTRLKENSIDAKDFFRWKLLKIFNNYRKINKNLLEEYSSLFTEYGIHLKLSWFYKLKHFVYLKIYPLYKFVKNKKKK